MSDVLRALDRYNLVNQRGYQILIETFALKVFDEKRNQKYPLTPLECYVNFDEASFANLADAQAQEFVRRMTTLRNEAASNYTMILSNNATDWSDLNHVRAVVAIVQAFQDYSFVRSSNSDLYQLVFYNFANSFVRDESAQFLTPIAVIDFLVQLVNPRRGESVFDPCCGIADFLSLAFVHSQRLGPGESLDDANIYGVDVDNNMIMLATLNMLLNGDGEAQLFYAPDKGSIRAKVADGRPSQLAELVLGRHANGNWEDWPDRTRLKKFDVILTNPPFGEDRAYRPVTQLDREVIECYETWPLSGAGETIDLGVVFLENAYRCLAVNGRLGMVLSNSIASIDRWESVRLWLMDRMRIVGLFDLPANVFAETGVNTTLLVAYKPDASSLARLNDDGYSVFTKEINRVGYEKRTRQRNVFFNPIYILDPVHFEATSNEVGEPILDEEFSETVREFQTWAFGQEERLQKLFVGGDV